ncbi:ABC transporter permease [Rheinheimera sp.]|uniref:ABC transporter permease n=1 Tax=Rheinheimera sp. TaxID=1869214 RepID=UPI0027352C50|nr:ABC transporter permease [Rheinheimera sp.]MDP2715799.1 ABC transporter permease [Rheinheimera sp.]
MSAIPTQWSRVQSYLPGQQQLTRWLKQSLLSAAGIAVFVLLWQLLASQITTSLGSFPGPMQVAQQWSGLVAEHKAEKAREAAFFQRQLERNTATLAANSEAVVSVRPYNGRPTFFSQIFTSLYTVLTGFVLASMLAIPAGIVIGLSPRLYSAFNPLIQLFKPVSPLAWLPLVTILVSALYQSEQPLFARSFLVSVFTVTLCSLWPTLLNTIVGVSNISPDLQNVSRVLQLNWLTHVRRIVLPSAVPMIFTGLRLSLGIAWMVLIAAEMLAQNPGLGKFVWDEFQNGSSDSLSRICVAVLVIGLIGYALDRLMLQLQQRVNWDKSAQLR